MIDLKHDCRAGDAHRSSTSRLDHFGALHYLVVNGKLNWIMAIWTRIPKLFERGHRCGTGSRFNDQTVVRPFCFL